MNVVFTIFVALNYIEFYKWIDASNKHMISQFNTRQSRIFVNSDGNVDAKFMKNHSFILIFYHFI